MSDTVSISVVIPVLNGARSIDATLASLTAQDFKGWQAIVVDDGSTDATCEIVDRWRTRDDRIALLRAAHGGVSSARNLGIDAAENEWLLFLDADDTLESHHLARMAAAAELDQGADIFYADWRLVTRDGDEGPLITPPSMHSPFAVTARTCPFPIHAALVRRARLLAVGRFNTDLKVAEDWDLWQRLARGGARFSHVAGAAARYTLGAGTASSDVTTFLKNGLRVIRNGHSGDPSSHGEAMPIEGVPVAELEFMVWVAARTIGMGADPSTLFDAIDHGPVANISPAAVAANLIAGMTHGLHQCAPDWPKLWPRLEAPVTRFLDRIAGHARTDRFARRTMRHLERQMAGNLTPGVSRTLGGLQVVTIEAREPIHDIPLSEGVERVLALVTTGGHLGGRFEVMADGVLAASAISRILVDDFGFEPFEPIREAADGGEPEAAVELPGTISREDPEFGQTEYWEGVFAHPDPWDYTNAYESLKYEQTLAALPAGEIPRALELACAEGHFTSMLAGRVGELLATDISPTAVSRAQQRCAGLDHLSFAVLDFAHDDPPGDFDLIVCSEVLYYVGDLATLSMIADRLARKLRPGGHILTAHANLLVDEPDRTGFVWPHPFGAKMIGETFAQCAVLQLVSEHSTELYRIHLLKKADPKEAAPNPQMIKLDYAKPLSPAVEEQVHWQNDSSASARAAERMPILAYHRVARDSPSELARYAIDPDQFEAHLSWLRESGFTGVSLRTFEDAVWGGAPLPERPVMVTFDDGYRDNLTAALPLLAKYGMPATIFLVTDHVGGSADWDAGYGPPGALLDWEEIKGMAKQGITFAAHSAAHIPLTGLAPAELAADATKARKAIEDMLGTACTAFAYPYGEHDEPVARAMLDGGYKLGFTCEPRVWERSDQVMRIPRFEISSDLDIAAFAARIGHE